MSAIARQLDNSAGLLRALEAATHWRAITLLLGTLVGFIILLSLGALTGSPALIGLLTLIGVIELVIGFSATGFLLMDQASEAPERSIMDALLAALFSLHRLLGIAILVTLAFLAVLLVVAVIMVICKLPLVGPLLYAIALPITSVAVGVAALALFYVGPTILLPSVWQGHGVLASMARLWTVVRQNLLMVVIHLLLLSLILFVVTGIVWGVAAIGSLSVLGVSVPILGYQAGGDIMGIFNNLMMMMSGYGDGGETGYVFAFLFGFGVLYAVAACIPGLVGLSGACHIYLRACEGLDFAAAEARLAQGMEEARRRAQEAQARAQEAAAKAREKMASANAPATGAPVEPTAGTAETASPPAASTTCPNCRAAVEADDVFCGNCGARLKD